MVKFNRSEFMKQRHAHAREQRTYYKTQFGEDVGYGEFLKNESPLQNKIISYDVSFQATYRGEKNEFEASIQTFKVFGLAGQEAEIERRAMNLVLDSRGEITGKGFNSSLISEIEKSGKATITPRGMEESFKKSHLTRTKINNVVETGFIVEELDKVDVKGKTGKGKMNLDINHFL